VCVCGRGGVYRGLIADRTPPCNSTCLLLGSTTSCQLCRLLLLVPPPWAEREKRFAERETRAAPGGAEQSQNFLLPRANTKTDLAPGCSSSKALRLTLVRYSFIQSQSRSSLRMSHTKGGRSGTIRDRSQLATIASPESH